MKKFKTAINLFGVFKVNAMSLLVEARCLSNINTRRPHGVFKAIFRSLFNTCENAAFNNYDPVFKQVMFFREILKINYL